jgi:hypothetical protein
MSKMAAWYEEAKLSEAKMAETKKEKARENNVSKARSVAAWRQRGEEINSGKA